jgi:hypothetical protein
LETPVEIALRLQRPLPHLWLVATPQPASPTTLSKNNGHVKFCGGGIQAACIFEGPQSLRSQPDTSSLYDLTKLRLWIMPGFRVLRRGSSPATPMRPRIIFEQIMACYLIDDPMHSARADYVSEQEIANAGR